MKNQSPTRWATIPKIAEETGLTVNAIRAYIKKGMLQFQYHWVKAPNGRIMIDRMKFDQWISCQEG